MKKSFSILTVLSLLFCASVLLAADKPALSAKSTLGFLKSAKDPVKEIVPVNDRDNIIVLCSDLAITINLQLSTGSDIVASCGKGDEAIKILGSNVYHDTMSNACQEADVCGSNDDDIIVICPAGVAAGVTVNGFGGNDIIMECTSQSTLFIF